jgi:hypothetical protein
MEEKLKAVILGLLPPGSEKKNHAGDLYIQ